VIDDRRSASAARTSFEASDGLASMMRSTWRLRHEQRLTSVAPDIVMTNQRGREHDLQSVPGGGRREGAQRVLSRGPGHRATPDRQHVDPTSGLYRVDRQPLATRRPRRTFKERGALRVQALISAAGPREADAVAIAATAIVAVARPDSSCRSSSSMARRPLVPVAGGHGPGPNDQGRPARRDRRRGTPAEAVWPRLTPASRTVAARA